MDDSSTPHRASGAASTAMPAFDGWDGSIAGARALQAQLAARLGGGLQQQRPVFADEDAGFGHFGFAVTTRF